jgi:hypothetical protein
MLRRQGVLAGSADGIMTRAATGLCFGRCRTGEEKQQFRTTTTPKEATEATGSPSMCHALTRVGIFLRPSSGPSPASRQTSGARPDEK